MNILLQHEELGNNSTKPSTKEQIEALQKVMYNRGGTVTYVFVEERLELPNCDPIEFRTCLVAQINPQILFKESRGKLYKNSPQEVLDIFKDTAWDNGASYFILD